MPAPIPLRQIDTSAQRTLIVDANGQGHYETLANALAAATAGDVILLKPGSVHNGPFNVPDGVTIKGAADPYCSTDARALLQRSVGAGGGNVIGFSGSAYLENIYVRVSTTTGFGAGDIARCMTFSNNGEILCLHNCMVENSEPGHTGPGVGSAYALQLLQGTVRAFKTRFKIYNLDGDLSVAQAVRIDGALSCLFEVEQIWLNASGSPSQALYVDNSSASLSTRDVRSDTVLINAISNWSNWAGYFSSITTGQEPTQRAYLDKLLGNVTFNAVYDHGNLGATPTIDFSAGQKLTGTVSASITAITFTAPRGPGNFMLELEVNATGGYTLPASAWPASVITPQGGKTPDFDGSANAKNLYAVYYDGTNYWLSWAKQGWAHPT